MSPFGTLEEARLAGYALRSSNFAFGNNNSLPPCVGRLGWGGEVAMKLACCSFTHPLTPSRQGRGDYEYQLFMDRNKASVYLHSTGTISCES